MNSMTSYKKNESNLNGQNAIIDIDGDDEVERALLSRMEDEQNHSPPTTTITKNSHEHIGSLLKQMRENKGYSLKLVSQQTKIHLALLESLENNQLLRLPSKTYVKGFVKSYAKLLGIPLSEAMDLFEKTYRDHLGIPDHTKNLNTISATSESTTVQSSSLNWSEIARSTFQFLYEYKGAIVKSSIGLTLAVLFIVNFQSLFHFTTQKNEKVVLPEVISTTTKTKKKTTHYESTQKLSENKTSTTPSTTTTTNITSENKLNTQEKITLNQTQQTPKTDLKDIEAVKTDLNIITKDQIKSEIKLNDDLTLKPISAVQKQYKTIDLTPEEFELFLPKRFQVNSAAGKEAIFVNAVDGDSWLTYKVDNQEIKKFVLRQGRTLFISGKMIRLYLGNTKNLKVFYNNKPIEFITANGTKNAVFPDNQKAKFMTPLFIFQKNGSAITSEDAILKLNQDVGQAPVGGEIIKDASSKPLPSTKISSPKSRY